VATVRHVDVAHITQGTDGSCLLAVVGAHLSGQPLNHELTSRGAVLMERTATARHYRMYRLAGGPPMRPALDRVGVGCGHSIEVEVWAIDHAGLGAVTAGVAPPLGIGSIELLDGRWVKGFICEPHGLGDARDITVHGSWRSYLAAAAAHA
jgi:allophanate hydrolase